MRALKILVVVMGILLIGGFATLIAVIAHRFKQQPEATAVTAAPTPATAAVPFTASPVELPAGSRLEAMAVGADRLVLHMMLSDGNRELLVIDLASGRRLGTIPLRVAP